MPFIFTPFIAIYDFNSHLAFCLIKCGGKAFLFDPHGQPFWSPCANPWAAVRCTAIKFTCIQARKWMMSIIITRRITLFRCDATHNILLSFDLMELNRSDSLQQQKTPLYELILWMCKCAHKWTKFTFAWIRSASIQHFLEKIKTFDLDKSKPTINWAALSLCVCVDGKLWNPIIFHSICLREKKAFRLAFSPIFLMRHFRAEKETKMNKATWSIVSTTKPTCDHLTCTILKRMPACARHTVYLSSPKTQIITNKQANKLQKKTKTNKAHLCVRLLCLCLCLNLFFFASTFFCACKSWAHTKHPIRNEFSEIDVWTHPSD